MTEDGQNLTPGPVRDGEPVGMFLRKQDHRERGKEVMGEHRTQVGEGRVQNSGSQDLARLGRSC